jgi:hypothetical protein
MTGSNLTTERRTLQVVVALLAAVPVLAGLEGIVSGPAFTGVAAPWPTDLDSHMRFLSGVFLAIGIAWYSCIPGIEAKTRRFRLLAALTVCGGLARLASAFIAGAPSAGHRFGLVVELLIVPLLVLWQARIARSKH